MTYKLFTTSKLPLQLLLNHIETVKIYDYELSYLGKKNYHLDLNLNFFLSTIN